MNKFLKILFPFYNTDRHNFLLKKWWFRLFIVIYLIGLVVSWGAISNNFAYSSWGWCYAITDYSDTAKFEQHLSKCGDMFEEYRLSSIFSSILAIMIIHYLIQFIFFKIIINFIALGGKK